MIDVNDPDHDRLVAVRVEQEARRSRDVLTLFSQRSELKGVYALADLVGEQTLWCA